MSERILSDPEKIIALERLLKRMLGDDIIVRYRKDFLGNASIEIVNPDAQRLMVAYQPTDYDVLDFETELIEDVPSKYSWFLDKTNPEECEEGFPVYDEKSGEMTGLNPKYTSILVATIDQYEDPYEKIERIEKVIEEHKKNNDLSSLE